MGQRVAVVVLVGVVVGFGACAAGRDAAGGSDSDNTADVGAPAAPTPSPSAPVPGPIEPLETISVSSSGELVAALRALASSQRLSLAAGTYVIPGDAFFLPEGIRNVAISGATGNRDDVVIRGGGMNGRAQFGFWVGAVDGALFEHLTIRDVREHGVIVNCGARAPVWRDVRMADVGDQFVKVNPGPGGCGVDDGVVEDSVFEYSTQAPDDYTNGVDVHHGAGWTIRRNTFRNFSRTGALVGPAVLIWNGSRETVVEDNTFVDNSRDVALGLDPGKPAQPPVGDASLTDHRGGRVTRNTITRRPGLPGADVAISVADSPGTVVDGNRVTMNGTYPNAIEYRFPRTTGVVISGNVVDAAIVARDGATATVVP